MRVGVGGGGGGSGGGVFFRGCNEYILLIDVVFVYLHITYHCEDDDVFTFVADLIVDFV
jgi:hypothetical protein